RQRRRRRRARDPRRRRPGHRAGRGEFGVLRHAARGHRRRRRRSRAAADGDRRGVDRVDGVTPVMTETNQFDSLVEYLRRTRGFDFNAYKRPSLMRRVEKRMQHVAITNFSDYTDYLEVHPEEFGHLFNVILINVTSFFRDELAWDYLREHVVPALI